MNRAPDEDDSSTSTSPVSSSAVPDLNGNSFFSSWTSSVTRRRSSIRAAFGDTNSALAAITGILIQRPPRDTIDELDPGGDQHGDVPPWAAAATTDPDSIARGFRFPGLTAASGRDSGGSRSSSFGSASGFRRQGVASPAASSTREGEPATGLGRLAGGELKRAVFLHERDKRTMSGLSVPAFTKQAFVSSFTVGMAVGSLLAIVVKVMRDLTWRLFE